MTQPAHLMLLSPIPEEERSEMIRDVFDRPWSSDTKRHYWRSCPPSETAEGYAQWKRDVADKPSERHPDWPKTCVCGSVRCYADQYCTNPLCPTGASIEGHDLLYAIRRGDIVAVLSIFSLLFPGASVDELAEFIRADHYRHDNA